MISFDTESTDTASEMLYDSFDHDHFLSSESFDMEDTCFLDDITEEDITACIGNEQVLVILGVQRSKFPLPSILTMVVTEL